MGFLPSSSTCFNIAVYCVIVILFVYISSISNFVWWVVFIGAIIGAIGGGLGWFYARKAEAMMGMMNYADQSTMQYGPPQYDMSQMQMQQQYPTQQYAPQQMQYVPQQYAQPQ